MNSDCDVSEILMLNVVPPEFDKDQHVNLQSFAKTFLEAKRKDSSFNLFKLFGKTGSGKTSGFANFISKLSKAIRFAVIVVPDNNLVASLILDFQSIIVCDNIHIIGITDINKTGWQDHLSCDKTNLVVMNISMFGAVYSTLLSGSEIFGDELDIMFDEPDDNTNPSYRFLPIEFISHAIDVCEKTSMKLNIFLSSATHCQWINNLTTEKIINYMSVDPKINTFEIREITMEKTANPRIVRYVDGWQENIKSIAEHGFKTYYSDIAGIIKVCIQNMRNNVYGMTLKLENAYRKPNQRANALRSIHTLIVSVPGYIECDRLSYCLKDFKENVMVIHAKDAATFTNKVGTTYNRQTVYEDTIVVIFATPTYGRGVNAIASYLLQFPFSRNSSYGNNVIVEMQNRYSTASEVIQMQGRVGRFAPAIVIFFGSEEFCQSLTSQESIPEIPLKQLFLIRSRGKGLPKARYDRFQQLMMSLCGFDTTPVMAELVDEKVLECDGRNMKYVIPEYNLYAQLYGITESNTPMFINYIKYLTKHNMFNHRNVYMMLVYLELQAKISNKMDDFFNLPRTVDERRKQITRVNEILVRSSKYINYSEVYAFNTYRTLWLIVDMVLDKICDFSIVNLSRLSKGSLFNELISDTCRMLYINTYMVVSCLSHNVNLLKTIFGQYNITQIPVSRKYLTEEIFLNYMTFWTLGDRQNYRIAIRDPIALEKSEYTSPEGDIFKLSAMNPLYDNNPNHTKIMTLTITKSLRKPKEKCCVVLMGFSLKEYEYSHFDILKIPVIENNHELLQFVQWFWKNSPRNYNPELVHNTVSENLKQTTKINTIYLWSYLVVYCLLKTLH